jgi:KDO2-lipid IV(A) lauroyltransferase
LSERTLQYPRGTTSIELPPHKLAEARDFYRIPLWIGTKLLYALAPVSLLFRFARAKGTLAWLIPGKRRQILARMERFYGETRSDVEVRQIARRYVEFRQRRHMAQIWPQIRGFAGHEACHVDGLQHLEAALAAGRGAILVTMHFGYPLLIKLLLASKGYTAWRVGLVAPEAGQRPTSSFTRLGLLVHSRLLRLPRTSRPQLADLQAGLNLRPLLAALGRNEVLIIPLDTPGRHSKGWSGFARAIPVLGKHAVFAPGAISVARATGARVLPAFGVDSDDGGGIGIRLDICPPLDLERSERRSEDVKGGLEEFAAVFEEYLRRYPYLYHCDSTGTSEGLQVGERVKVKGLRGEDGSFVASMVKIRPSHTRTRMRGVIDEIDRERGVVCVLDRDVRVPAACRVIDQAGGRISLRDLPVGTMVELTGIYSVSGGFVASSIQVFRAGELEDLLGAVESVAPDGRTFHVLGFRVVTTETTKVKDRTEPTREEP